MALDNQNGEEMEGLAAVENPSFVANGDQTSPVDMDPLQTSAGGEDESPPVLSLYSGLSEEQKKAVQRWSKVTNKPRLGDDVTNMSALKTWVWGLKRLLAENEIASSHWAYFAAGVLDGHYAAWAMDSYPDSLCLLKLSLEDFVEELKSAMHFVDDELAQRSRLCRLPQDHKSSTGQKPKESLVQFHKRLIQMVTTSGVDRTDVMLRTLYAESLSNPKVREAVLSKLRKTRTLGELMKVAVQKTAALPPAKKEKRGPSNGNEELASCGLSKRECLDKRLCMRCGESGHFSKDCPSPGPTKNQ